MEHETSSLYERRRAQILELIPSWYNPIIHFVVPAILGLTAMIVALANLRALRPIELLAVPLTLLAGFGFEWRVHKWVLHHRTPGLGVIYDRHELQHHVVYTNDDFVLRSWRELWLILMPAYAVVLVFLMDVPIALLIAHFVSWNTGLLSLATAMVFFLSYEWLHACYHMPPTTWIGRSKIIARLREHHRRHHDPRLMKKWNFNVTFPMFDFLYRTTWSPERESGRASRTVRASGSGTPAVRPVTRA